MRRASFTLLPALLAALILPGCSADERAAEAPVSRVAAAGALGLGVTDGRTGDAVTRSSTSPLRSLSGGGELDASEPPRPGGRRDGVGAGDACPEQDLMPAGGNLDRVQATTLCLLNGQRADFGLAPLTLNDRLARAALGHSADMVARSYFAHEGADGSDIEDRIGATGYIPRDQRWTIGENLAWGTGALATPGAIVNAWMNSPGHRANVLNAEYREIGFGIVIGNPRRTDGSGATYATEFGAVGDGEPSGAGASVEVAAPARPAPSAAKPKAAPRKPAAKRRKQTAKQRRAKLKRAKQARARRSARR